MSGLVAFDGSQALWFVSRRGSGLAVLVAVQPRDGARGGGPPGLRATALAADRVRRVAPDPGPVLGRLPGVARRHRHIGSIRFDRLARNGAAVRLPAYRTSAIALGTLAIDLGAAVMLTSLFRQRLGYRAWRAVHWLAYLSWPVAFAHSLTAGNDLGIWWVALTEWVSAAAVATAVVARMLPAVRRRIGPHGSRPMPRTSTPPVRARERIAR